MAQLVSLQLAGLSLGSSHSARSVSVRSGFFQGTPVTAARAAVPLAVRRAPLSIQAKYRGQGTDLSQVAQFQRHETDCGSEEVQIARLTARVQQLTEHLKEHRKDFASTRGLMQILGQRKRLMKYLQKTNRPKYEEVITTLGIRPLKLQASRGRTMKAANVKGGKVKGRKK